MAKAYIQSNRKFVLLSNTKSGWIQFNKLQHGEMCDVGSCLTNEHKGFICYCNSWASLL